MDWVGSGPDGISHNSDPDGNPNVFNLEHNEDGVWLNNNWTKPTNKWKPDNEFVFRSSGSRNYILFRAYTVRFFFSGLAKLLFQPPSILPTSSNFIEISSYCLCETSFASQATWMRNF